VETNSRMLNFLQRDGEKMVSDTVRMENSEIIQPCFIGEHVELKNSVIGPNVSIGEGCIIKNSAIKNSLIQTYSEVENANLDNAMIGNYARFKGDFTEISIGDYSVLE